MPSLRVTSGRKSFAIADNSCYSDQVILAKGRIHVPWHIDRFYDLKGRLHAPNGKPAVIDVGLGRKEYWVHGKRHRWEGPAMEVEDIHACQYWLFGHGMGREEFEKLKADCLAAGITKPTKRILKNVPSLKGVLNSRRLRRLKQFMEHSLASGP